MKIRNLLYETTRHHGRRFKFASLGSVRPEPLPRGGIRAASMKVAVHKIAQSAPNDVSGLQDLIEGTSQIDPKTIVAIMGKTEGNGCVNDFTRGYAISSIISYLEKFLSPDQAKQIVMAMSGGTEGVLSPHLTVFTKEELKSEQPESDEPGLVLGVHHTRDFTASEIGTLEMVRVVAEGVKEAMNAAKLVHSTDVHFVQIKCPLLTTSSSSEDESVVTTDSYKSMAYARAASALGVAVALGEIPLERISSGDIGSNFTLYSSVASTSAGLEVQNCEILVLGNSLHGSSEFVIGHSVMKSLLDGAAVDRAMPRRGSANLEVVQILAKAEAHPSGKILGCRHTMMEDSDINHTRMARAVAAAVLGSVVQDPMIFVSGGAEHQGPSGGGPIAVICRKKGT